MKSYQKFEPIIEKNCTTIRDMVTLKGLNISTLTVLYRHFLSQLTQIDTSAIQCSAGCHYCCYLKVTASIPEILIIMDHLEHTDQLDLFRKEIKNSPHHFPASEIAEDRWWVETRIPCLFLNKDTRLCKIYEVRPFTCRGYHSLDKQACQKGYEEKILTPIPCYPDLKRSREVYSISFERAMQQMGKDSKQVILSEKATALLTNPHLIERWLQE